MELSVLLIIGIIGYLCLNYFRQNSPEAKIERLESLADGFYPSVVKKQEESVKKWRDDLQGLKKIVIKDKTISKELLAEIRKYKNDYSGFMDKHKNVNPSKKMELSRCFLAKPTSTTIPGNVRYISILGTEKNELLKLIENTELQLKETQDIRDNYVRLKEKHKHDSGNIKLALAQDYFDYHYTRTRINNEFKHLDYADNELADRIFETMRELEIKAEEIVKRFNRKIEA